MSSLLGWKTGKTIKLGNIGTQVYSLRSRKAAREGPQTALSFLAAEPEEQNLKHVLFLNYDPQHLLSETCACFRIKARDCSSEDSPKGEVPGNGP